MSETTFFVLLLAYLVPCIVGMIERGSNPHGWSRPIPYDLPHRVRAAVREQNLRVLQWENSQPGSWELGVRRVFLILSLGRWDCWAQSETVKPEPKGVSIRGWHIALFAVCLIVPAVIVIVSI
jgi:hypothetical protein